MILLITDIITLTLSDILNSQDFKADSTDEIQFSREQKQIDPNASTCVESNNKKLKPFLC